MEQTIIDILENLESNNSRIFKEELLTNNNNNKLLKRIFVTAGNPYLNFYVNKFKMPPARGMGHDDLVVDQFLDEIYENLASRKKTGNAAKEFVEYIFSEMTHIQQKWCLRILLKNLRCGVQSTTVNKVWPDAIVGFSVQLAESLSTRYEEGKGIIIEDKVDYPVRVEPKLDGLRCVTVKHGGEVTMFTRNGTPLETLPKIRTLLEGAPWDDFVLDGEIMGADWNESASVVMSHKKNKDDSNMVFHVFDAMRFEDWHDQENILPLSNRIELVQELVSQVSNPSVVQVQGRVVNSEEDLLAAYLHDTDAGYEGVMIKDLDAHYVFKRSSNIRKMKPVATYEGIIVGHYEGRRGSKREGLWGGFEVMLSNGIVTRVGSGFTDKMKAEINLNPDSWIGRIVEMEGQPDPLTGDGLTKDGKVRFPVYIRERDSRDVDPQIVQRFESFKNL
jgi:ATP-dependent DNA ligase